MPHLPDSIRLLTRGMALITGQAPGINMECTNYGGKTGAEDPKGPVGAVLATRPLPSSRDLHQRSRSRRRWRHPCRLPAAGSLLTWRQSGGPSPDKFGSFACGMFMSARHPSVIVRLPSAETGAIQTHLASAVRNCPSPEHSSSCLLG